MKSPDELCSDFSEKGIKVTIRSMEDDYILIEGTRDALEAFGQIIVSQANNQKDCGFQLSTTGAGKAIFSGESNLGLYVHRIPCSNKDH